MKTTAGGDLQKQVVIPIATLPLLPREDETAQAPSASSSSFSQRNGMHLPNRQTRRTFVVTSFVTLTCLALAIIVWSHVIRSRVASDDGPSLPSGLTSRAAVRFLALGDWGRDGDFNQSLVAKQMSRVAADMAVQFVVSTGDNFYDSGLPDVAAPQFSSSFTNVYSNASLQVPWYSVLGNHDYYGNALAQLHPRLAARDPRWICRRSMRLSLPLCQAAESQIAPCEHTVDLFLYDSTPLVREYRHTWERHLDWRGLNAQNWTQQEEAQLQELEGWLSSSHATWKVVIGHHPVFSFGEHGSQPEMVERVKPIMERHSVDLYLNGHDHNLQHIKREDSPVHFITSGGGSKAWREQQAPPRANSPGLQYFWPGQGFAAVEVDVGEVRLSFVGNDGMVMHRLVLKK